MTVRPVTVTPYAASTALTGSASSDFVGRRVPANQVTSHGRRVPFPGSRQNPVTRPSTRSSAGIIPLLLTHSRAWCSGVTNRARAFGS